MMATPTTFERQELKYSITHTQRLLLEQLLRRYMQPDSFGRSTIHNVYYDTPDKRLIRRSLEKPVYKEKLRVRSYGTADMDSTVYVELKKKFRGVVYKRRTAMTEDAAKLWLDLNAPAPENTQIIREISHFKAVYYPLLPSVHLSYQREAFFGQEDGEFRMTFDDSIVWRNYDLSLTKGAYGQQLLAPGVQLLEVKAAYGIPLWLARFFSEQHIFKTTFSKYGSAYAALCQLQTNGGFLSA